MQIGGMQIIGLALGEAEAAQLQPRSPGEQRHERTRRRARQRERHVRERRLELAHAVVEVAGP